MNVLPMFDERACSTNFSAKSKDDALKKLAQLACKSKALKSTDWHIIYDKILAREKQGTTGFGNEVAIPHARIEELDEFLICIAVAPKGIDFDSMDKKKTKILILLLGPEKRVDDHLKVLALISRTLSKTNAKQELLHSVSNTVLVETFLRNTRVLERKASGGEKMKALVIILYFDDLLYDILEFFIEEGIEGATVIESFGMGEFISNIPIFADFIGFMRENKNHSKTILTLIPESRSDEIIAAIEEITGDLDKKQGAMVMLLDVGFFKGTMRMM